MKNILETIVAHKKQELEKHKRAISLAVLREKRRTRPFFSLQQALTANGSTGIIAEFKRKSPSKGWIWQNADPCLVVGHYVNAGAAAISILTDNKFFGGTLEDLKSVSQNTRLPILRKDFIVDEYQIVEASKNGADAILLIAACLSQEQICEFSHIAKENQLEVLLEVHNQEELKCICKNINIVGVNNRNLKSFDTQIVNSLQLAGHIPNEMIKISESGIRESKHIHQLRNVGYKGFLVGESLMRSLKTSQNDYTVLKSLTSVKRTRC